MPEGTATLDLFTEDVSTKSWEELVESLLPGHRALNASADPEPDIFILPCCSGLSASENCQSGPSCDDE